MAIQSGQFKVVETQADKTAGMAANLISDSIMPLYGAIDKSIVDTATVKANSENKALLTNALTASIEADPAEAMGMFEKAVADRSEAFSNLDSRARAKVEMQWEQDVAAARYRLIPKIGKKQSDLAKEMYSSAMAQSGGFLQDAIMSGDANAGINTYLQDMETLRQQAIEAEVWSPYATNELFNAQMGQTVSVAVNSLLAQETEQSLQLAESLIYAEGINYNGKGQDITNLANARNRLHIDNVTTQQTAMNGAINNLGQGAPFQPVMDLFNGLLNPNDASTINLQMAAAPRIYEAAILGGNYKNEEELEARIKELNGIFGGYLDNVSETEESVRTKYKELLQNEISKAQSDFFIEATKQVTADATNAQALEELFIGHLPNKDMLLYNGELYERDEVINQLRVEFGLELLHNEALADAVDGTGMAQFDQLVKFVTKDGDVNNADVLSTIKTARGHLATEIDKRTVVQQRSDTAIGLAIANEKPHSTRDGVEHNPLSDYLSFGAEGKALGTPEMDKIDADLSKMDTGPSKTQAIQSFRDAGEFNEKTEQSELKGALKEYRSSGEKTQLLDWFRAMHEGGFGENVERMLGDSEEDKLLNIINDSMKIGYEAEALGLIELLKIEEGKDDTIKDFLRFNNLVDRALRGDIPEDEESNIKNLLEQLNKIGYGVKHGSIPSRTPQMGPKERESVKNALTLSLINMGNNTYDNITTLAENMENSPQTFLDAAKDIADANQSSIPQIGHMPAGSVLNKLDLSEREVLTSNTLRRGVTPEDFEGGGIAGFYMRTALKSMNFMDRYIFGEEPKTVYNSNQETHWSSSLRFIASNIGEDAYIEGEGSFVITGGFNSEFQFEEGGNNAKKYIVSPIYEGDTRNPNIASLIGYNIMEFTYDDNGNATGLVPTELMQGDNVITPSGILSEAKLGISLSQTHNFTKLTGLLHSLEEQLFLLGDYAYFSPTNPRNLKLTQEQIDAEIMERFAGSGLNERLEKDKSSGE